MRLTLLNLFLGLVILCIGVPVASAHVVVKPKEVGLAEFQTFTIGVPNEKDMPTTGVRLVIPEGLQYVSPNVKPGWKITTKKEGEGEEAKVMEISWTDGTIPPGQRDEFLFSAKVPAAPTTLIWKAYQTYQDGTVVAWDQNPASIKSGEEGTPYSSTAVINDLKTDNRSTTLSIVALVLSVLALALGLRNK